MPLNRAEQKTEERNLKYWNNLQSGMQIIRPHITLLVLVILGLLCLSLMIVIPEEGIDLAGYKLKFKTWQSLTDTAKAPALDLDAYLASLDSLSVPADSTGTDSLSENRFREPGLTSIQFANNDPQILWNFFAACDSASLGKSIHIAHYGDSQIETDRISGILRQSMQEKFGGYGPGLIAPVPVAAGSHVLQSQSDNWVRYTAYGYGEKVSHNAFGALCSFAKFTSVKTNKESNDSTSAWIELKPTRMGQARCKTFSEAKVYLTAKNPGCSIKVFVNDSLHEMTQLDASSQMQTLKYSFGTTPAKIRFEFTAIESPDVYAINLQGKTGVQLSNIALRGNDGTALSRVGNSELSATLNDLNSQLIILQFGGNAVPYLSGESAAKSYGKAFKNHIRKMKSACPGAAIIVIGPSDMSTSINGEYQTWPYLEELNEGMKEAALEENCGFWDMFSVMGGKNSMISWVNNDPPYAGPDYTHFTPVGSKKIADLFYKALIDEYEHWKKISGGL